MRVPPDAIIVAHPFEVVTHKERAAVISERHSISRDLLRHVHGKPELKAWSHMALGYR